MDLILYAIVMLPIAVTAFIITQQIDNLKQLVESGNGKTIHIINEGFDKLIFLESTNYFKTTDKQIIDTALKNINIGETVYYAEYRGDNIICHSFICGGFIIDKNDIFIMSEDNYLDFEMLLECCFTTSAEAIEYVKQQRGE